jgi:hypothetical protein
MPTVGDGSPPWKEETAMLGLLDYGYWPWVGGLNVVCAIIGYLIAGGLGLILGLFLGPIGLLISLFVPRRPVAV